MTANEMNMAAELLISSRFDRRQWEIADSPHPGFLMTWHVEPDPVDAGMPQAVQEVLAVALSSLGKVVFAHGDPPPNVARRKYLIGWLPLPRRITVVFADTAEEVRLAFDASDHQWSLGAQWLAVVDEAGLPHAHAMRSLVRDLYGSWRLPSPWPEFLLAAVQAGVDGDAAAVRCRNDQLLAAFERRVVELAASSNLKVRRS